MNTWRGFESWRDFFLDLEDYTYVQYRNYAPSLLPNSCMQQAWSVSFYIAYVVGRKKSKKTRLFYI